MKTDKFIKQDVEIHATGDFSEFMAGCCDEHEGVKADHVIAARSLTAHSTKPDMFPHLRFGVMILANKDAIEKFAYDAEHMKLDVGPMAVGIVIEETLKLLCQAFPGDKVIKHLMTRVLMEIHNATAEGAFDEENFFSVVDAETEIAAMLSEVEETDLKH